MRERLQTRLDELRKEFETGQQKLNELEAQVTAVRNTLLRISGAIQVIEEELANDGDGTNNNAASDNQD